MTYIPTALTRALLAISFTATLVAIPLQPATAATYATLLNRAIPVTTTAALKGSVVSQRFTVGTLSDTTKLTIQSKERYRIDNPRRTAISLGAVSYEHLETELAPEELAAVREAYPQAAWYTSTAYPDLLEETFGYMFDDLRYATARGSQWKSTKSGSLRTYRFKVAGSRTDLRGEAWFGVTKTTAVDVSVTVDSSGRITALTFTGPSKRQPNILRVSLTYGPQVQIPPAAATIIGWEEVVLRVPSMGPFDPAGWETVTDLSSSCVEAIAPIRLLQRQHSSGAGLGAADVDVLNTAFAATRAACSVEEFDRWFEREFYGWFNGDANTDPTPTDPGFTEPQPVGSAG